MLISDWPIFRFNKNFWLCSHSIIHGSALVSIVTSHHCYYNMLASTCISTAVSVSTYFIANFGRTNFQHFMLGVMNFPILGILPSQTKFRYIGAPVCHYCRDDCSRISRCNTHLHSSSEFFQISVDASIPIVFLCNFICQATINPSICWWKFFHLHWKMLMILIVTFAIYIR